MLNRIATFRELLELLDRNPECAEAMRTRLLPPALLAVPEQLSAFIVSANQRFDTINQRFDAIETDVSELKTDVTQLKEGQTRMQGQINGLWGEKYERRIAQFIANTARRDLRIREARCLTGEYARDPNLIGTWIDDAEDRRIITPDQGRSLERADLILAGCNMSDRTLAYAVVEVSLTIDTHDIDRAAERAHTLSLVLNRPVVAAVIGDAIADPDRRRADAAGVIVVIIRE